MADVTTDERGQSMLIGAPAAKIYEHLCLPANHLGMVPGLHRVRDVRRTASGISYVGLTEARLGPLRYWKTRRVTMTFPAPGRTIRIDLRSRERGHELVMLELTPEDRGTTVTETVRGPAALPWLRMEELAFSFRSGSAGTS